MLNNFRYHLYTDFIFGDDAEKHVGEELTKLNVKKVMIIYGGQSVKKIGLYDDVISQLNKEGISYVELGGVQANPRLSLIRKGVELAKKEKVELIIAMGGGSVIDTSKAVGMGYYYDGDVWDLSANPGKRKGMLPVAVILTYPAAGSESSKGCVVTNDDSVPYVKASISGSPFERPILAFENPKLTFSLNERLTACGVADMYVHIWERYFSPISFGSMDYLCEALMKALIEFGPKVLAEPDNYEYRGEIMWIGTMAHNDTCGNGRPQDWSTHGLGHELSALYDTTHGASLTIMGPAWMKYVYKDNLARFARYARNVYDIKESDDEKAALAGIEATKDFFHKLGLPTSLEEAKLPTDQLAHMAAQAARIKGGKMGIMKSLKEEDNLAIYNIAIKG